MEEPKKKLTVSQKVCKGMAVTFVALMIGSLFATPVGIGLIYLALMFLVPLAILYIIGFIVSPSRWKFWKYNEFHGISGLEDLDNKK